MNTLSPDQESKKRRIELAVKGVALLGLGFVVAPFVFIAIKGLIGLLIAGTIGLAGIYATPAIATKLANWRLKLLKSEASKNPVETLQNQYIKKQAALDDYKKNMEIVGAQVLAFQDEVKQYVKDGMEDAPMYQENLAKLKQVLSNKQQKYLDAKAALAEFADTIQKTDRKWKMAVAASKINEAAGQLDGDAFDKICIDTAVNAVQDKMNQVFAALDMDLLEDGRRDKILPITKAQAQLPASTPVDIESTRNNKTPIRIS